MATADGSTTCKALGAGKWRDEYSETLRGKDVVVFGDVGDENGAGERHTKRVIESLTGKAKSIKHVALPDGFHDVSDYIASLPADEAGDIIRKLIEETPEVEPQSLGKSDGEQTDLTSLSSPVDDEFPAPLEEASFYGLAGDIVRRILPHTEADSAALLFQLLAAFGNIIGRTAYMVADGTRHYLNIFVVLVGETSKGRKGTAWQHVLRLFEKIDELWRENCIAQGLRSGEGLIYHVRDPISEKQPVKQKQKFTGEYETVVTDHGVEDKRLLAIEPEFSSVLKVMNDERNILSPVIRMAWDSGSLRTLIKHNPTRATGAHISIVGHITRQEARRDLTETESANGFGNRILWLAVRRSKCLPEGGGLPGIADLIDRVKKAAEFAAFVAEVRRDEKARELWARVYPELSEGKTGLLGAITARAEAQVLRLSAIYALLDFSNVIGVQHLRAALALWNYCERSSRWIFGAGTGNKNADRILTALKAAGEKGLRREQITVDVFNRHASKFEIDEALRLLHSMKLAIYKPETTPTKPAERWFYNHQPCEVCEESVSQSSKTGDTSHSSHPQRSKNVDAGVAEPKAVCMAFGDDDEGEL
jgi:hypothetical protein